MKYNKKSTTATILEMTATVARAYEKLELKNIVFPKWSDIGLTGMMFRQMLKTKEQPDGCLYDEAKFQTVLRVVGGKVLMSGRPDTYCWKFSKLESAKDVKPIGINSAAGLINLSEVLMSIGTTEEKSLLADMFTSWNRDLLLVTTASEKRTCVEITRELYDAGLTHCVDEWMDEDDNGMAEATALNVGDYLVITNDGVYCIRHDEFMQTHIAI